MLNVIDVTRISPNKNRNKPAQSEIGNGPRPQPKEAELLLPPSVGFGRRRQFNLE